MENTITTEKVSIKLWLKDLEPGALAQARNIANHPRAYHHVAIMPDAHEGYGMPIGGILAARGAIIPNAVGVDIGCGVSSLATSLAAIDIPTLKAIMGEIRRRIPLGFEKHKEEQDEALMPAPVPPGPVVEREWKKALRSLGTLGGGNHFLEIQKSGDGKIFLMLHSGSRNLGKQIADHYNQLAVKQCRKRGEEALVKQELAYLEWESAPALQYYDEMRFAVDYALANRRLMMERFKTAVSMVVGNVAWGEFINIAHNYAALETHFGEEVIVHRKGATEATAGLPGIIPGSQGTRSYLVRGLGNPESFNSCAHGAGRRMGRNQAIRELDLKAEISRLDRQGIVHAIRDPKDLDEASGAYKDIDEVIRLQSDLVEVVTVLEPLAVVKG